MSSEARRLSSVCVVTGPVPLTVFISYFRLPELWCAGERYASSASRLIAARRASHCAARPAIQLAVSPSGSVRTL